MPDIENDRWVEQLLRADDDPAPTRELWPDPDAGPYLIELEWTVRKGRAEAVSFTVRTAARVEVHVSGGKLEGVRESVPLPLKSETRTFIHGMTFRDIKPGQRIEAARARAAANAVDLAGPEARKDSLTAFLRDRARPFAGPGRRGPAIDPDEYAEVLAIYLEAKTAGKPAARAVAQRFNITEGAARKRYARAKRFAAQASSSTDPDRPENAEDSFAAPPSDQERTD